MVRTAMWVSPVCRLPTWPRLHCQTECDMRWNIFSELTNMSKDCQASAADPATQAVLTCLVGEWWQRPCSRSDTSGVLISGVVSSCGRLPVSVRRLFWLGSTFHSCTEGKTGSRRCRVFLFRVKAWVWLDATQLTVWPLCWMLGDSPMYFREETSRWVNIIILLYRLWYTCT